MATDLASTWRRTWPALQTQIEALVLVAFRLLYCRMEERRFFPGSARAIDEARRNAWAPRELGTLLRTRDSLHATAFADAIHDRLAAPFDATVASLAYGLDRDLGLLWSKDDRRGDRVCLKATADAVNAANRTLREHRPGAIVLVRPKQQFWERHPRVVGKFPLELQDPPSTFKALMGLTTSFNRVDYSTIGGGNPRLVTVALWPTVAPKMNSPALIMSGFGPGKIGFRFKLWKDLPPALQADQRSLADRIAAYVNGARDAMGTVHIVAAPELVLAPEAHHTINAAVATRRSAAWILFPGSYHVEAEEGVINRAVMRVGGMIDKNDLFIDPVGGAVAAVKRTPFNFPDGGGLQYVEDIDGSTSCVHVLDTDAGRIATMICRDFIDVGLTKEVVSMGVDHLFVLSMSPDSGTKFEHAMEVASDYRTATFLVNAYTPAGSAFVCAGLREPLKHGRVSWKRPTERTPYCVFTLKPSN